MTSAFDKVPRSLAIKSLLVVACLVVAGAVTLSFAQGRIFTLIGDIKVDESNADERVPMTLDVFLYRGGNLVARERVGNNDRYRFNNLSAGQYEVVVEIEGREVARLSKLIAGQVADDVRLDINLAYRKTFERKSTVPEVISVADAYPRSGKNKTLHQQSKQLIVDKKYEDAIASLRELVALDPKDYPAWFQLGVVYFIRKDYEVSEKCFVSSSIAQPSYLPANFNLGRVRLARKNFEGAIDALEKTIKLDSRHAEAFYFLGETYLQLKKGSFAVGYFEQALKLDPSGMAEAHLKLASLYNLAGYKSLAATEYENFLRKNPEYAQRKKLEEYIAANKGKPTRPKP